MFACQKKPAPQPEQQPAPIAQPAESTAIAVDSLPAPAPAEIISAIGEAFIEDTLTQSTDTAKPQMKLKDQNILDTKAESKIDVSLGDSSDLLMVNENSRVSVKNLRDSLGRPQTTINIPYGRIFVDIRKLAAGYDRMSIRTPSGIAAIRGTAFEVIVDKISQTTEVKVVDGTVELRDNANQNPVMITPAQKAQVSKNRKPSIPIPLRRLEVENIKQWIGGTNVEHLLNRMTPQTREIIEKTTGALFDKGASTASRVAIQQVKTAVTKEITRAVPNAPQSLDAGKQKALEAAAQLKKQAAAQTAQVQKQAEKIVQKTGIPVDTAKARNTVNNLKKKLRF